MGIFSYGPSTSWPVDDRLLLHVQVVISAKFQRGEAFYLHWPADDDTAHNYTSVWLDRATELSFHYDYDETPALNRAWIDELALSANSPAGLRLTPEPRDAPGPEAEAPPAADDMRLAR